MSILVIDVGSTNVKAVILEDDGSISRSCSERVEVQRRGAGQSEFDANELGEMIERVAHRVIEAGKSRIESVGITAQRASTVLWDTRTKRAVDPGLGWQDLRTVGQCLSLQADGIRVAPNQSATKLAYLLSRQSPTERAHLRFSDHRRQPWPS